MLKAKIVEEQVLEPLQGSICLAGNCESTSLILCRVDFYQVLKSVVIDVICGTMVQSVAASYVSFQLFGDKMEHLTYNAPIVARIPPGKSARTSFLHVRCEILLNERRRARTESLVLSPGLCTNVPVSCGLGWLVSECSK